ncbi:uncharacterized protein LOC130743778 [Lotus japonicus]|uniref:uncharacterized protein LOC130743778 n=1 Tax=Lotus japonicus TaxID=34305 RepID=UPI0025905088|nr:uncharacterized protein LOC130743778 [Lotus japonicus]
MSWRLNLCDRSVKWIKRCLESCTVSVLFNGNPCEEFKIEKRLRQGDPMTPFFEPFVAYDLNGLLKEVVASDKFSGRRLCVEWEVRVLMFQFVDDTIYKGDDTLLNVIAMKFES